MLELIEDQMSCTMALLGVPTIRGVGSNLSALCSPRDHAARLECVPADRFFAKSLISATSRKSAAKLPQNAGISFIIRFLHCSHSVQGHAILAESF
jgi:hypothetical protein